MREVLTGTIFVLMAVILIFFGLVLWMMWSDLFPPSNRNKRKGGA